MQVHNCPKGKGWIPTACQAPQTVSVLLNVGVMYAELDTTVPTVYRQLLESKCMLRTQQF